ncbi:family 20 glycosylhydrolase [uncultured Polaribacter sp.]|uniref:family 20 glycosylhydrolase n=1 Tax=uncultured Polaribacter sp. TaxID=174711 RepID=UPI00261BBF09|nr:family 20 glycosylhydrolase [uncultured Polaribacter sp.]
MFKTNKKIDTRFFLTFLFLINLVLFKTTTVSAQQAVKIDFLKNTKNFKVKGFHLDLRIQVMTPKALKEFASELSKMGMNTLVLEWEGTYPFENHVAISNRYSYTRAEIKDFIAHCEKLDMDVIPLQQTLGHVEYILRNTRYSNLKEDRKDISQLCPMEVEDNKELFAELFRDLSETHNSKYIHIGGDETYLLGHCDKCKQKVAKEGKSKLFVDHMKMIADLVISLGKKPVMWADIILKYPEAASELPKETIFVDWNYGWKINHFGDIPNLQKQGFTFWGAPAIRCHPDNWYVTDWTTHFKNQKEFIPYAREANYQGIVMTSWSTTGVYGFTWDVNYDVIDMVQVRNTYPLAGFRILIASYAAALESKTPIKPKEFVLEYAKNRFGLNSNDAQIFSKFLFASPELIKNGKPTKSDNIKSMILDYCKIRDELVKLKPKRNEKELNHFKLMADLRIHYLDFRAVESQYNSVGFKISQTPILVERLDAILKEAEVLNMRFINLNKGFLYDSELEEQNELRVQAVHVLRDRLVKLK